MTQVSPQQQISQILSAYWISQSVYVAAKLRIADMLKDGPRSAGRLAAATDTNERCLYRLLRALASVGIFAEQDDGSFVLTPMAEYLRTDVPGSQWAMAVMMGEEHYRAWGELLHCVRTGEIAFDKVFGKPIFAYLSENPEQAAVFDRAMTSVHGRETEPIIDAYDFSEIGTIVDVGGGNGTVITAVLKHNLNVRGILFDLHHVVERAKAILVAEDVADRCEAVAGSFFESVPEGADAYMMRHIIHDWDAEKAATILRNCRVAMKPNGRVLVIDSVIAPGNEPSFAKLLDLTMMAIPGGMERTEAEFHELFSSAGLELVKVIPTASNVCIVEGRPSA